MSRRLARRRRRVRAAKAPGGDTHFEPHRWINRVMVRNLEGYQSAPTYVYSEPLAKTAPLRDTDHFLFLPSSDRGTK